MVVETTGDTGSLSQDTVEILESNVDDVSGEVIAYAITRFLNAGARDASALPIIMKKGRPGFLIQVICTGDKSVELATLMARELGTLGIRCIPAIHRFVAERTIEYIDVEIAGNHRTMAVKFGWMHGESIHSSQSLILPGTGQWSSISRCAKSCELLNMPAGSLLRKIISIR